MDRRWIPLLLVPIAAVAFWLLAFRQPPGPPAEVDLERAPSAPEDAPVDRELSGTEGLQGRAPRDGAAPAGPTWPVVPSDRIPRGTLEVLPHGPDLQPLDPSGVQMRLERPGAGFWSPPLGIPDGETKVWTFSRVPYGKVVLHVWGDHLLHQTLEVDVPADATERVEVFLDRGGAVAFSSELRDGTKPASVKVRLLSPRSGEAVRIHFQTRRANLLTSDVEGTEATLGDEGLLFAVPPGRYVLEAESAEGDRVTRDVEISVGDTTEVELFFSY